MECYPACMVSGNLCQVRSKIISPSSFRTVNRGKGEGKKRSSGCLSGSCPAELASVRVPLGSGLNELRPAVKPLLNMLLSESEGETHGGNGREGDR